MRGLGGGQVSPRWVIYPWGRKAQRKGEGLGSPNGREGRNSKERERGSVTELTSVPGESLGPLGGWSCTWSGGHLGAEPCLHFGIQAQRVGLEGRQGWEERRRERGFGSAAVKGTSAVPLINCESHQTPSVSPRPDVTCLLNSW